MNLFDCFFVNALAQICEVVEDQYARTFAFPIEV